jgi:two-component system, NarL family, sensor histidine kinase UhpB
MGRRKNMRDGQAEGATGDAAPRRGTRSGSLYGQLVLIPTIIMIAGFVAMAGVVLIQAHTRIVAETRSSMKLARDLAAIATRDAANSTDPASALERLSHSLPQVRHVEFQLVPSDETLVHGADLKIGNPQPPSPSWLARILSPPVEEQWFPVSVGGRPIGTLRLRSNPADEIAEIVGEIVLFSIALALLYLLIVGTLLWAVRRSLRSIGLITDGFDRLERGDYRPMPPIPNRELRRVGEQLNHLAQSLRRVTADNHFLIDKLLSVQEQERRQMAAELHDEFGPALFGIRAEATCILRSGPGSNGLARIYGHARAIADLTEGMQRVNSRMLGRLRPLVLEQMGLHQAIRELVTSWQERHPQIKWSFDVPEEFNDAPEEVGLVLYRVVLESVTNAIRHANASAIDIRLGGWVLDERETDLTVGVINGIRLAVQDDGFGLSKDLRYGLGLLGMTERVRRIGGILKIANTHPRGVIVEAFIPTGEEVAKGACVNADLVA